MLRIFKDFSDANEKDLMEIMLHGTLKGSEETLLQLKGQILAFRTMLDIKTLILDAQEDKYENLQSTGATSITESEENFR